MNCLKRVWIDKEMFRKNIKITNFGKDSLKSKLDESYTSFVTFIWVSEITNPLIISKCYLTAKSC